MDRVEVTMRLGHSFSSAGAKVLLTSTGWAALAIAAASLFAGAARADENGVSFWLPGLYSSLAAVPGERGWSFVNVLIANPLSASGTKDFPRGGSLAVGLDAQLYIDFLGPTYTFAEPVLGGQLSLGLLTIAGQSDATISGTLTGPGGATISRSRSDTLNGFGDLYPQATLKWNSGVNNYMTYLTGDIPVGSYDPDRLANLGIGHGAIDGGAGYTYLNPATGHEFSIVGGITGNFENTQTNYQNGIDYHIDWAASQFLSKQFFLGPAGYFYGQLSGDSGSGDKVGAFESSTVGLGGQAGYIFPVNEQVQGFLGLKGYADLATENRLKGWSVWLTLNFSPAQPKTKTQ
jgi:hypothetical protein